MIDLKSLRSVALLFLIALFKLTFDSYLFTDMKVNRLLMASIHVSLPGKLVFKRLTVIIIHILRSFWMLDEQTF